MVRQSQKYKLQTMDLFQSEVWRNFSHVIIMSRKWKNHTPWWENERPNLRFRIRCSLFFCLLLETGDYLRRRPKNPSTWSWRLRWPVCKNNSDKMIWVGGHWLDMATSFATSWSAVASTYVVSWCSGKGSMRTIIFRMNTWSLYESAVTNQ